MTQFKISTAASTLILTGVVAFTLAGCQQTKTPSTAETDNGVNQSAQLWPQLSMEVKKNAAIEARIDKLLSKMTIEQKVAQTIQPEIRDFTVEDMRHYGFGSYLNGGGSFPKGNKHASVKDWVNFADAMYQASMDSSIDGIAIPTMWGTDAVHGHNNVIGATLFPHNIGLGAMDDPAWSKMIAQATAEEVAATGIDWAFAPTVAVVQDDRWGRTYESYSEDPALVERYAHAFVQGMQGEPEQLLPQQRVISTVKHFIGDGGTQNGDDQGDNLSTEQQLVEIHAPGYFGGLSAGAQTVMASFNSWHGKKNHGNHYLLTEVLKNRLGFDGLVVGDWNGHGQVKGCTNESCSIAFNAGVDIFMVPGQSWKPLYENTIAQVKSGEISMERLNDAVRRILRVKFRAGLFDKPSPAHRALAGKAEIIGNEKHRAIAREAVRKSLVLLKNNHQLLPLSPKQNIVVVGDAANNIAQQSGGWSITWQGTENTNADFPGATSIYQGIANAVTAAGGHISFSSTAELTSKPDVAIVVFGETPYAEGHGDLANLEFERGNKKSLAILKALKAQNIPVVSVFITGRPLWINPELNASDAFVVAWLPGSEGQGVADVILTDASGNIQYDFEGKLPFSWPKQPSQAVLNFYQTPYEPLFAYRYGLTYQSNKQLPQLDETIVVDSNQQPQAMVLFNGVTAKPWQLMLGNSQQQLAMTTNTQTIQGLTVRTTDKVIQEDALSLTWDGSTSAAFFLQSNFPNDLREQSLNQQQLQFSLKLTDNTTTALTVAMNCRLNCTQGVNLTNKLAELQPNQWYSVAIDLTCFAKAGVDFAQIANVFTLESAQAAQISIADLKIDAATEADVKVSCSE